MRLRTVFWIAVSVILVGLSGSIAWNSPAGKVLRYHHTPLLALSRITAADPRDFLAWRELGLRLARDGDGQLARPALESALALHDADPEVATALGEILMSRAEKKEALQLLRLAVARNPDYPFARMALGRLYRKSGAYHHAAEQFQVVAAKRRDFPDAWYELAVCYLQLQQVARARAAVGQALKASPREPEYLALRGAVSAAVGEMPLAISSLTEAARAAPDDVRIQADLASLLLAHHRGPADLELAEHSTRQVERLNAGYALLPYLRGRLALSRQDWRAAVVYLEQSKARTPDQDEIYYALSQAYRRQRRVADAERELIIYRQRQDLRRRIDEVRIALDSSRDQAPLYARLAGLQWCLGERDSAIASLENCLRIDPRQPQIEKRLVGLRAQMSAETRPR